MKKFMIVLITSSFLFAFNFTFTKAFNNFNEALNLLNRNPSLAYQKFHKAYKLIQQLKNKNSSQVDYMLGRMYSNGWGVEQNYKLAEKYLLKALKLGNQRANCCLAKLYFKMGKITLAQKYLHIALSNKYTALYCNNLTQQSKELQ